MGAKSKQSALKQLRSSLSSAGIIGPKSHISKKQKKKGNAKLQKQNTHIVDKLREIQQSMNPFNVQKGRSRLEVLGAAKRKGQAGNPVLARQKALEKRRETLLPEIEGRNHVGAINDRRFGENNPNMSIEDKMLERFTRERQRRSRNAA
ncbi:nucleolar complex protein 14, partial [Spiromyces aspiralis]